MKLLLFALLWMVEANFILVLFLISPYYILFSLASIRLFHLTLGLFELTLFCVTFFQHIFMMLIRHCRYFFSSNFLAPRFPCCKYTLTEPPAPKTHVLTPSTANALWGQNIEDLRCQGSDEMLQCFSVGSRVLIAAR